MSPPRSARTAPVRPTLRGQEARSLLLLPAFWLVTVLLMAGGWQLGRTLRAGFVRFPTATTVAVILFALYAIPFWAVIGAVDYLEREPPILLATAFAWGALVATSLAVRGSAASHNLIAKLFSPRFAADWGPALVGPTVEESAKVLGLAVITLIAARQLNSVLDGAVYGAMVGLGFQVVEDIVFALAAVRLDGGGDHVDPVVTVFLLRGFLAGLWSHTLFGTLAGIGVGYLVVRVDRSLRHRVGTAALAFAGAWLAHFIWNSPFFSDGLGAGDAGVLAVLVLKGAPTLIVIVLLVRDAGIREADYYIRQLTELDIPGVITDGEVRVLPRAWLRFQARRDAKQRVGASGFHAVRALQRAQAKLAVELSRAGGGAGALEGSPAARRLLDEVLAQRRRLRMLKHCQAIAPVARYRALRRSLAGLGGVLLLLVVWLAIRASGAA